MIHAAHNESWTRYVDSLFLNLRRAARVERHSRGDNSNSVACLAEFERAVCQPRLRVANAKEQTGMGLEPVAKELRVIGGVSL
jgi:hypothetical protein